MSLEGASAPKGRRPSWLGRATDIRFLDYTSDKDDTLLVLGVPAIGEAAGELYRQQTLWDTRPSPRDTAVEVLSRVVQEVHRENEESDWFDTRLLARIATLDTLFSDRLKSITLPRARTKTAPRSPSTLDANITATASRLSDRTPPSRQVRVVGTLDMIRRSTRSFGLKLDDGAEIRGVFESAEPVATLGELFGQRVLVHGRAVYRPSGRPLRIDATAVEPGEGQPALFSKVPPPMTKKPVLVRESPSGKGKRGVAAFFGTWPGDETAADFERMLREIRSR